MGSTPVRILDFFRKIVDHCTQGESSASFICCWCSTIFKSSNHWGTERCTEVAFSLLTQPSRFESRLSLNFLTEILNFAVWVKVVLWLFYAWTESKKETKVNATWLKNFPNKESDQTFFQVQVFASLGQLEHQAARMEGASGNNQTFRQQCFVQIAMIIRLECLKVK